MRQFLLVAVALAAFAGNSLLCRAALRDTATDPASFTAIRLAAGALVLWALTMARGGRARGSRARGGRPGGSWGSAVALFAYAGCFSFAYTGLATGTGALLLFGAVQATMIGRALWSGDRLGGAQAAGLLLALAGLVALLLPGLAAPPAIPALLMLAAGGAWGVYTIRGRMPGDATFATAGNFLRAVPFALALLLVAGRQLDAPGALYAALSGALASGLGYAVWYAALPGMAATVAATVQLCVPALAGVGAAFVLGESLTMRLLACSAAILGGIALVTLGRPGPAKPRRRST